MSRLQPAVLSRFALALLVATGLGSGPAFAADDTLMIEAEGVVQDVSVSESKVQITGIRYEVESQARVQVRGTRSSIAALETGMKVRFVYEVVEGFEAEMKAREDASVISSIEQLPDDYVVEEY